MRVLFIKTLALSIFFTYSGNLLNAQKEKLATISIQKDASLHQTDTAKFTYQNSFNLSDHEDQKQSIIFNANNPAILKYYPSTKITKLSVFVAGESQRYLKECYIEPGDNITIRLKGTGANTTAQFTGKGAEKYTLKWQLDSIDQASISFIQKQTYVPINLKTTHYKFELIKTEKLKLLESKKQNLSSLAYELYKEDIIQTCNANSIGQCTFYLTKSGFMPEIFPIAKELISKPDQHPVEAQQYSQDYYNTLLKKSILNLSLQNKKEVQDISDVYNDLKKSTKGLVQQKILFYYLSKLPRGSTDEFTECLTDALSITTDTTDQRILNNLLMVKGKGSKAYNFSLENEAGRKINLSDFKGKIVLLDFWFTGCPACLKLAKTLKDDVFPQFKNNKNFVHISINTDNDKAKWLQSVASGKYTASESITLSINEELEKADVIHNYNVKSFPTLMIIDKTGNIYSSNIRSDGNEIVKNLKALH